VACGLEDAAIGAPQAVFDRPRVCERSRIGHGQAVLDRVGVDPLEALHDLHAAGCAAKALLVVEVHGLDHRRVALPAAA
jgi:hypothetical protein